MIAIPSGDGRNIMLVLMVTVLLCSFSGWTTPSPQEEPKKVRFDYDLFLHLEGHPPVNHLRCEKLTFNNPTEEFRRKLLKAGGVGVRGRRRLAGHFSMQYCNLYYRNCNVHN